MTKSTSLLSPHSNGYCAAAAANATDKVRMGLFASFDLLPDGTILTISRISHSLFHSSSNSISATTEPGVGSEISAKGLVRSKSSSLVIAAQDASPTWSGKCSSESLAKNSVIADRRSEADGQSNSSASSSADKTVNLMRSPSYQSTTSAMKNDIK